MTTLAFLDTSAFLKLFMEERDSATVLEAIQEPEELWALRLMLTEARVTLERLRRDGRLDPVGFRSVTEAVDDFWEQEIKVLDMDEATFLAAERVAVKQPGIRSLDALHLGAARVMQREWPHVKVAMLSCDQRVINVANDLGLGTPLSRI